MTWMWLIWFLIAGGSFAFFEGYAFKHPDRQWTLSRTIATLGAKWPLSIALWGMFFGGLLTHFFWHFGCDIGVVIGSLN